MLNFITNLLKNVIVFKVRILQIKNSFIEYDQRSIHLVSVNTMKHLKNCCFIGMKYSTLGEDLMTNIALDFASCYTVHKKILTKKFDEFEKSVQFIKFKFVKLLLIKCLYLK